jgi:quercetin dioxygenase-like cupin family protein
VAHCPIATDVEVGIRVVNPLIIGVSMKTLICFCLVPFVTLNTFVAKPSHAAEQAVVNPIMQKVLSDLPGKEVLMITVDYPPGAADPIHRHNAHVFVYVLEGSVVMQVRGGKEVTLTPGQTFYEGPKDVHIVGRNASDTIPAKFLVVLVKNKGAPPLVPAK